MKKKSPFTLLEILISISIAGILFSILFSKFREFASLRKEIKQIETACLERQQCEIRLQGLFELLTHANDKEASSPLYTKQKNLYFKVHQPVDADPAFIGELDCSIQFEKGSGQLRLTMKNHLGQQRDEILSRGILNCKMRFFSSNEGTWLEEWPQTVAELPVFVSILCEKSTGEIEHLFPIHFSNSSFSL
jgi:type II secretory pathway pseudopilin PulG